MESTDILEYADLRPILAQRSSVTREKPLLELDLPIRATCPVFFPLSMLIQYRDRARSMGPSAGFTAAAGSDGAFLTRPLKAWHVQRGIFSRMML
ncbi:hypothetical protein N7522_005474 [Penicillium canescens]|uniref:Uncharacterized protein n=1 Tax=Penicillium canescens TaxID=5083 RepID=A0AAD6IIN6_PENCN|nr:hypothetical protein N7522_005474 [Penicillium canescens]KAJ6029640.1 hypothetical protein N7444_012627 [Penicillium canescens]KAJ6048071.1 hypothetical protein N7460_004218 [Penicillium canescens]